jgi:hypothetical protein
MSITAMRRGRIAAAGLAAAVALSALAQAPAGGEGAKLYQEAVAQLDPGGDVFFFINVQDWLKNGLRDLGDLLAEIPGGAAGEGPGAVVGRIDRFCGEIGLHGCRALGFSSVPRPDGLYTIKVCLFRDAAAAHLPLWKMGEGDGPLKGAAFLPRDCVAAQVSRIGFSDLWAIVRQAVGTIGGPEALEGLVKGTGESLRSEIGLTMDEIVAALGRECVVGVQFSETETATLDGPGGALTMPYPSYLVGVALKDPAAFDTLMAALQKKAPAVRAEPFEGAPLYLFPPRKQGGMEIEIAVTTHAGFLLLGTRPQVVRDAIAAFKTGGGLTATEEFRSLSADLPKDADELQFTGRRFALVMQETLAQARGLSGGRPNPMLPAVQGLWMKLFTAGPAAAVRINKPWGLYVQSVTAESGRAEFMKMTLAPTIGAAVAGVVLPMQMRARAMARGMGGPGGTGGARMQAVRAACMNNLRMIEAAKAQWAIENSKPNGSVATWPDLQPFLPQAPRCPQGGQYLLGTVGDMPRCSLHGAAAAPGQ